jgi:Ca2+-binding EF-hand superfamily protein
MPHYLRDARSRFVHYASIKKKGNKFMTAEDFVCALLGAKDNKLEDPKAADELQSLFNATDADGDGKLSFNEFSFLMVLLTTKQTDFELCFQMLDTERRGSLSAAQFIACIRALGSDDMPPALLSKSLAKGGGIMAKLFGSNFGKRCTLQELAQLTEQLRLEVWKAEFRQYDPNGTGAIPVEKFAALISSQMLGSHLPIYIVQNTRTISSTEQVVGFASWVKLNKLMLAGDELAEAVELFTRSGQPLRKTDFANAVRAIRQPPLTSSELDLVFSLFDKNGDGSLEFDEFYGIMMNKINFHVKEKKREKEDLFTRLVKCAGEAVDAAMAASS